MANEPAIANHPDRAAIEMALANDVPLRKLAKRHGLSMTQLSRYRTNHMDDVLITRLRLRGHRSEEELAHVRAVESKSLLDQFAYQRGRFYVIADRCARTGDDEGEIRAIAEAGKTTERIAKLVGELGAHITINNTQINFAADPRWHAIRTELVRALRPFPDAWQAAIGAIERAEAVALPAPNDYLEHAA